MHHLKIGDKAPDFVAKIETGKEISLSAMRGQKIVLFFYPKDDTPGCTKQCVSVKENYKQIKASGYKAYGISPDKFSKHTKFKKKFKFPYSLIEDPDHQICESYGVWGPKKFMGMEFIGVHRAAFLIDESGIITAIIDKVVTKEHGLQILESMIGVGEGE